MVLRHVRRVRALAAKFKRRRPYVEFDDLLSAGYLALVRAVPRFRPELGFVESTYFEPRIRGSMRDYLGERGRHWFVPLSPLVAVKASGVFAARLEYSATIRKAIALLPPRQRRVMELMYNGDLNQAETSKILGVSYGQVSQWHTAAIAALRETLLLEVPSPAQRPSPART